MCSPSLHGVLNSDFIFDGGRVQFAPVGLEVSEVGSRGNAVVSEADVLELAVVRLVEGVPNILGGASSEPLYHGVPFLELVVFSGILFP